MQAVCGVAQAHERRVAAHARNAESIKLCLRHGVQIIYHANLADEEARDLLEAHRHEVFVAPTAGLDRRDAGTRGRVRPWFATRASGRRWRTSWRPRWRTCATSSGAACACCPAETYGFAWNPNGTNARDLEHFSQAARVLAHGGDPGGDEVGRRS